MKIVLSRKGFDSGSGGVPNPILPNGQLVPLPIPATRDPHIYDELTVGGMPLGPLVEDLTAGKIEKTRRCHLDPDLDPKSLPRLPGWRPAFGQIDTAQSHLARHGIGEGDLFLFFGWFRAVEQFGGRWRYVRNAPNLHVIYGWMHVGNVISLANRDALGERLAPFADHPHLHGRADPTNTLYLAADRLRLLQGDLRGAGIFRGAIGGRILTDIRQAKRSIWRLPTWFHPNHGTTLSYHENSSRWSLTRDECILSSAARGQEFVLKPQSLELAEIWLRSIFEESDLEQDLDQSH